MKDQQMVCFYHNADLDGKCSAAIVKYLFFDVKLVPFNYNYKIDWNLIDKTKTVVMVDISVKKEDMIRLRNESKGFIWIDHHISKINEMKDHAFRGIRNEGIAACELTWRFFMQESPPTSVQLLADYDVWKLSPAVLAFQYGMRQYDCNPENIEFWKKIFENSSFVKDIATTGKAICDYVEKQNQEETKAMSFLTNFRNYKVLATNKSFCSSLFFENDPRSEEVDILITFSWNGKSWKVSMYTTKDDLDVSKICQEFGGGGHRKAAGFFTEKFPEEIEKMLFKNS